MNHNNSQGIWSSYQKSLGDLLPALHHTQDIGSSYHTTQFVNITPRLVILK